MGGLGGGCIDASMDGCVLVLVFVIIMYMYMNIENKN